MTRTPRGRHDVIVVGGGISGLYAALVLAGQGHETLVLEEHPAIGIPSHCTGIVSAEVREFMKIPDAVVLHRAARCRFAGPGSSAVDVEDPGEEILVLDRAAFDQSLAAQALEAGASIRLGERVDAVEMEARGVIVRTSQGRVVRARSLVLAGGVNYRFQRWVGARLPANVLHSAQVELDAVPGDQLEVYLGREVAPEGFAWLVPVRRDGQSRVKAGTLLRGDAGAYLSVLLGRPEIRERLRGDPPRPVRRLVPVAPIARTYAERMLVVGDAAGLTKPVTGGGIFYSLLSASLAAETLSEALAANDLEAGRLAQYETRWRERLGSELRTAAWFRWLLTRLSDAELDRFIDALAAPEVQGLIGAARFNWHRRTILTVLRQPGIKKILLRSLFR